MGVDPYLLRTAVYEVLANDERMDAALVQEADDPAEAAISAEATVLVVSRSVDAAGIVVARISETPPVVELTQQGRSIRTESYAGLASLADVLAELGWER